MYFDMTTHSINTMHGLTCIDRIIVINHDEEAVNESHVDARARERGEVAISASIRVQGGFRITARVIDLSETGFRMECLTDIPDDRVIFLTMPSFSQLEARIAWRTEWTYGCEFAQPLHTSVYGHILKAHPALGSDPRSL